MSALVLDRKNEMAILSAISKGGSLGYNLSMHRLGIADNIPSSERFNTKLKKYGSVAYN